MAEQIEENKLPTAQNMGLIQTSSGKKTTISEYAVSFLVVALYICVFTLIIGFPIAMAVKYSGFSAGRDRFTQINDANMRNVLMTGIPANVNWEKGLHP